MRLGTLIDAGRVGRMGLTATAGLLALAVSTPASAMPLMPVPDPAIPTASAPATVPAGAADRVDRQFGR